MATADRIAAALVCLATAHVASPSAATRSTKRAAETRKPTPSAARLAQSPTYGVGRPATPNELKAIDIDVEPDGRGLLPGRGTAAEGKAVYAARCVTCHGATGREGPQDVLAGGAGSLASPKPLKTVGSYWPYATTVWDYIHRAMPFDHPGTLSVDDVYSVTAYVLFLNGLVGEQQVIDQATLPAIAMPNRKGFVDDPRPDVPAAAPSHPAKPRKGSKP
ncbi:MAG TPA: cytochrome c [Vicinamibacterales bacterium]|jgi:mono/diheme cytochrome c family protein|nr:cytochrome c [Vicinamibacterales bacterium]